MVLEIGKLENKGEKKGFVIALSAPSGTGKTTIANRILTSLDNITRSISINTRAKRPEEIDGVDYYFVTEAEFDLHIREKNLIEYVEIYGHRRGTPRNTLLSNMEKGIDTLCVIDWNGVKSLREKLGRENVASIFLLPPSFSELSRRLFSRGQDSPEEIERRLETAESEMRNVREYDYVVINDELTQSTSVVTSIILAERQKTNRFLRDFFPNVDNNEPASV
jgi:guanylate kinase